MLPWTQPDKAECNDGGMNEKPLLQQPLPLHFIHDFVTHDGDDDIAGAAGPHLVGMLSSQLQSRISHEPPSLPRYASESILGIGSENGLMIKPRSSYDTNTRNGVVEHDELPAFSADERLIRDAFRRSTRVALLSEAGCQRTEAYLAETCPRRTILMSSIDCPGAPTEVNVEGPKLRTVYNKVQGSRIDLASTLTFVAKQ